MPICACEAGNSLEGDAFDAEDELRNESDATVDTVTEDLPSDNTEVEADPETDICVPECAGRECGSNGCGATCAPGCGEDDHCLAGIGRCAPGRGWIEVRPNAPAGSLDFCMVYDEVRRVSVFFGGDTGPGEHGGTWTFDGTSWAEGPSAPGRSMFRGYSMAYDSRRSTTVLFGGCCDDHGWAFAETWEFDGTEWTRIAPSASPTPRTDHAMAFDAARGVVVLVGGGDSGTAIDTWEYDGATWTQVATPQSPPARSGFSVAYDEGRGVVVLFGGGSACAWEPCSPPFADTWEYDGRMWTEATPAAGPPGRIGHAMTYDTARGVVVLFGGSGLADTWEYDGSAWREVAAPAAPPDRTDAAMDYDPESGAVVLFGGFSGMSGLADTWAFDGSTWTEVVPRPGPEAFVQSHGDRMEFDSGRGVSVLIAEGEVWEYGRTPWFPASVQPPSPFSFWLIGMAHDSLRGVTVSLVHDDMDSVATWEYDGTTWGRIAAAGSPPDAIDGAPMAYDSARGVVSAAGACAPSIDLQR